MQEKELLLGAGNVRLAGEVGVLEVRAVDADVGEGRRVGEADGDLDGVASARLSLGRGGVGTVREVNPGVEEGPGGEAIGGVQLRYGRRVQAAGDYGIGRGAHCSRRI